MTLRSFLQKPRPPYRTASLLLGVVFPIIGVLLGIEHHFSNWPVVAFLGAFGAALLFASAVLSENALQRLFMATIAINVAGALISLVSGVI